MSEFIELSATNRSIAARGLVCGLGVNDAEYMVYQKVNEKHITCPYYMAWASMLNRCYSEKLKVRRPTYIGCTVCDDWLSFSWFKGWMENQDWQGKELDKDILIQGNKVYSPETCIFVTREINCLILNVHKKNRKYKLGVSKDKNKYVSHCNTDHGLKFVGSFCTENEAHEAYKKFKYKVISGVAIKQSEPLKSALLAYNIDYE